MEFSSLFFLFSVFYNMSFARQPVSNNPFPDDPYNGGGNNGGASEWESLKKKCLQEMNTANSEKTQTHQMIASLGSYEDSVEYRKRMYVIHLNCLFLFV